MAVQVYVLVVKPPFTVKLIEPFELLLPLLQVGGAVVDVALI